MRQLTMSDVGYRRRNGLTMTYAHFIEKRNKRGFKELHERLWSIRYAIDVEVLIYVMDDRSMKRYGFEGGFLV
jgi:hypothetical protein